LTSAAKWTGKGSICSPLSGYTGYVELGWVKEDFGILEFFFFL
jgi:hypothetical protein